ncbi:MAG TPA: type II toxin-antitoxin system RelE/ParE family toxin [Rhodanobacteraceae bacterium]|nr:type II toxin-antitoxin system RelE/ParE family toxin [Rhodanobacteraceae bacterium]
MVFIETPIFTAQVKELLSDDDYAAFQHHLADNPEAGDVIKGTGGLRKIRVAAKGHGKSGGARVIYYHFVSASRIALLFAYPKNVQESLTPAQKAALRKVIEQWR